MRCGAFHLNFPFFSGQCYFFTEHWTYVHYTVLYTGQWNWSLTVDRKPSTAMYVFKEHCRIIHGRTYFKSTAKKMDTCFKGTVQRDFLSPIFSLMESSQAPYSVFKDFQNLAPNSVRYSRFFIDSPQYFIAESPYSPYCLLRRVMTLRIILAGIHHLFALSA